MDKISVIVPCYNEEESLPLYYGETSAVLASIAGTDHEFIFVDDGSSDNTLNIIKKLAASDPTVKYVAFSRNFGKEAAMYAGLNESDGDYCVIMDADLQHPPAMLPKMYNVLKTEKCHCCGGLRLGREGDSRLRSFLSRAFYKIGKKLTNMDMSDGHGDFRMMNRAVADAILEMGEYNRYMKGIFSFVGFDTRWIEYESVDRVRGKSKWNIKSLFSYGFEGILSFSTAPLKMAGLMGVLLLGAAAAYLVFNIVQAAAGGTPMNGTEILLFVILLVSSLQMLFIYILGVYLSRDYLENKRRPIYIVKEKG